MIQALLHGPDEQLMVFAEDRADDRTGPYQDLAPLLLEQPEGTVQWLAESPDGRALMEVPADFIRALVEFRPDDAARLLHQAVLDDAGRTECLDPRPHGPHEWFNVIASLRRECKGRRHHRLRSAF